MAEKKPQTFANHTRWDPPFHFFVLPILLLGLLLTLAARTHRTPTTNMQDTPRNSSSLTPFVNPFAYSLTPGNPSTLCRFFPAGKSSALPSRACGTRPATQPAPART